MAGYFFFNNVSWAMKFNIISGTPVPFRTCAHAGELQVIV
jgi:hypothetical protein